MIGLKKQATINCTDDDKSFQYAATVALKYEEIVEHLPRISKDNPFLNTYNWKETSYPSKEDDCKKFQKNNPTEVLYLRYVLKNEYISCLHFISALLRGISSKHDGDFYCLIVLLSFKTKNKLESHKKVFFSA